MRGPALLLLVAAALAGAEALPRVARDLIGYSERKEASTFQGATDVQSSDPSSRPRGAKVLSWDPRIFLFQRLLTEEECDHMVSKAGPRLSRSGVVDVDQPNHETVSNIRTSYGMFFERGEDAVIRGVEQRLSEWSLIPEGHGEGLQVLRYEDGEEYQPHFDYFFDTLSVSNGGNRLATILIYLAEPEFGGETGKWLLLPTCFADLAVFFPNVPVPPSQTLAAGYSECAMKGLAVRPRKGDAVLFFSLRTEGTLDKGSLHGSCPTLKGTKYAATKWYHVAHYALGCKDEKAACQGWAEGGECSSNPGFMVGTPDQPGECLLSCGRCDLMPQGASLRSRRAGGLA
ncbi:putative prolyl 4-hydroxylase 7 [Chlorella vulgaris]